MDKCRINIAILEPSDIIFEGLSGILLKASGHYFLHRLRDPEELNRLLTASAPDLVIVNPAVLQNRIAEFQKIKKSRPQVRWVGLLYAVFDNELLNRLDGTLNIHDTAEAVIRLVDATAGECQCHTETREELSDRETDVLVELVQGFANKEIAERLSISIHTVISHRRNIMEKTGIKSLSGLTIYAITRKLIPLRPA